MMKREKEEKRACIRAVQKMRAAFGRNALRPKMFLSAANDCPLEGEHNGGEKTEGEDVVAACE